MRQLRQTKSIQCGFTLIEFMLYLGLTVLMAAIIGNIGVDILYMRQKIRAESDMAYMASFIFHTIERTARAAEDVALLGGGATSTTLSFSMEADENDPTLFEIYDDGVRYREGDGDFRDLLGTYVDVAGGVFEIVMDNDAGTTFRVTLDLTASEIASPRGGATRSFMNSFHIIK